MADPVPLIQIPRPELGRASDPRITPEYLDARPDMEGYPAFVPGVDVDLVGEVNNRFAYLQSLVKYASPELAAGLIGVLGELTTALPELEQTLADTAQYAGNIQPRDNLAAISASPDGYYRDMSNGWVYQRTGGSNTRRSHLEAVSATQVAAAQTKADGAELIAMAAQNAIGNLALANLSTRAQAAGPQLVGGNRWIWKAAGTPNGGTIVAAQGGGVWQREYSGSLNVKWFGAVGDGVADDWTPCQVALTLADAIDGEVIFPGGTFYFSQPLRTKHTTGYTGVRGVKITGQGSRTVLTRNDAGPADYIAPQNLQDQAILCLHGSNNILGDLVLKNARVGLYLGQDKRVSGDKNTSHASFNRISRVYGEGLGTGVLHQPGLANYYNQFNSIHLDAVQIGLHFAPPYLPGTPGLVSNRNGHTDVRVNRAWCGHLHENGDTNTFFACNFEGIAANKSGKIGPVPAQLLDGIPTAVYMNASAYSYGIQLLNYFGGACEACDRDVYYDGYGNNFIATILDYDTKFKIKPGAGVLGTLIGTYGNSPRGAFRMGPLSVAFNGLADISYDRLASVTYSDQFTTSSGESRITLADVGPTGTAFYRRAYLVTSAGIAGNSPNIATTVSSRARSIYWSTGGLRYWVMKLQFSRVAAHAATDPVFLKLPAFGGTPADAYQRGTAGIGLRIPVIVWEGATFKTETVYAEFTQATIAGELVWGLSIPAPSVGWVPSNASTQNQIDFQATWY